MKKELTRLFSVLLAAVLVFGTLPVSALGTDVADPPASAVDESAVDESSAEPEEQSAVDNAAQPEEQSAEEENVVTYASNDSFYKIVHLDCGRKYFTKDWIIALLYEMQNDGYNQLQLAFGNDGLRFLLNDMSFEANGTKYTHDAVVSAVETGNEKQNSSGDKSWLSQSEMDEIIDTANSLGIEIVPLLNLPGHANAILDIAGDKYNASGSDNTLNVADSAGARAFGMAIFQKYVDYFAGKGCKFFNFGADEYANDVKGTFSFNRLNESQYQSFVSFINDLAACVTQKGMIPRAFNDGFYFNNKTMNTTTSLGATQVCYWSKGWNSYNLAYASTIKGNQYSLINTNGAYYYVLGADDRFTAGVSDETHTYTKGEVSEYTTHVPSLYTAAADFDNTLFADGKTLNDPAGSMFCIWCDYPNFETQQEVAANTRLVLRAMAQRMDNKKVDVDESVVDNGFNADGSINVSDPEKVTITVNGNAGNTLTVGNSVEMAASKPSYWTVDKEGVVEIASADTVAAYSADETNGVKASVVKVTAQAAGTVTITATNADNSAKTDSVTLEVKEKETKTITVGEGKNVTIHVDGQVTVGNEVDKTVAEVATKVTDATVKSVDEVSSLQSGAQYLIVHRDKNLLLTNNQSSSFTNRLALNGQVSTNSTQLWTWDDPDGDGTGTLTDANGKCLTIEDKSSSVGEKESQITLSYGDTDTKWTISSTDGYYLNAYDGQNAAAGWNGSYAGKTAKDDPGSKWRIYKYTPAAVAGTDITFTGVTKGTTTVEIGGVVYTINVVDAALFDVTPLEIQYWITNARPTGKTSNLNHYEVTAAQAYSEEGITVADVVDAETTKDKRTQEYWKSVMLDTELKNSSTSGTELQTDKNGDDETLNGTVFTKVRYWDGKWQVYTTSWVDVDRTQVSVDYTKGNNESYTYKGDKNQLVAYYMEVVNIDNAKGENELHVNAADWGTKGDGQNTWGDNPANYKHCSVSVQVVYEDSTTNPLTTTASDLKSKTIVYGYWDQGRGLGTMLFTGENNYEIYKITAETGNMTSESNSTNNTVTVTGFTWANNEKVVWGGDDQEPVASASIGNTAGNPSYEKPYDNLAWNTANYNKNNAILIRVYVKYQAKEDSLTVHYVNEKTGGQFYEYSIAVTEGTFFKEDFALVDKTLVGNTVVNSSGITQTVESDLQKMAAIGAEYRYSKYECVRATRDDGGKDVYLYYNFDYNLSYVVDFGTPLKLSLTDLSDNYRDNETRVTDVKVTNQTHGSAVWNDQDKTITYTPNAKFVNSADGEMLNITVYGYNPETEETGNITYTVNIYPASNVLYEENFLSGDLDTDNRWKNVDPAESAKVTATQETQKVDDKTYNVFGYDDSYNASVGENGVWHVEGLEPNQPTKALTTSFYGNTFDLIGDCGYHTGKVMMLIRTAEGVTPSKAKIVIIDTRYNDGNGENSVTLSQVPLAHVDMGTDATYDVKIYASGLDASNTVSAQAVATESMDDAYVAADDEIAAILEENGLTADQVEITTTSVMDESGAVAPAMASAVAVYDGETPTVDHGKGTHVEIDGFRVYRSTDTENDAVAKNYPANEQNVTYHNILDVVKGEIVAYTELDNVNTPIQVEKYEANGGPQNEIYLTKEQSVYFQSEKLKGQEVQVSLRAVNKSATATVTGGVHTLASNTEMYYTIKADENGKVTIANNNDGLLAIGNVKLPSGVTTDDIQSASEAGDEAVIAALKAVLNTNVEPEVFTPETFTVKTTSTKVIRNKVVTLKINVSSDVAYVTINGVKYTRTGLQGMFQKTRTIRAVYTVPKNDEKIYEIIAYNADGVASEAITKTVK